MRPLVLGSCPAQEHRAPGRVPWFLQRDLAALSPGRKHLVATEDSFGPDLGSAGCWTWEQKQ